MRKKLMTGLLICLLVLAQVLPVSAQAKVMPDGNLFDVQYYITHNPDVVARLGDDEMVLYQHYLTFGRNEGRRGVAPTVYRSSAKSPYEFVMADGAVFDATYYLANNPDVYNAGITTVEGAYQHYLNNGKAEKRPASAVNAIQGGQYANDPEYNKFKFAVMYQLRNNKRALSDFVDADSYYQITDKNQTYYTVLLTTLASELTQDYPKILFTTAMFDAGTAGRRIGITYSIHK